VPFYPFPPEPDWTRSASGLALLTLGAWGGWRLRERAPYVLFGLLWYLIALLPVIGILQAGGQAHADRYMYVAIVGLSLITVWAIGDLGARRPAVVAAAGAVIVSLLFLQSRRQVATWMNSESLWRHTVTAGPPSYRAYGALGALLAERGQRAEAIEYLQSALSLAPAFADGQRNLGALLMQVGRVDEALSHLQAAVRLLPGSADAHREYGVALAQAARLSEAEAYLRVAIGLQPSEAVAHNDLGTVLALQSRTSEASAEFGEAIRLMPYEPSFRLNRAKAYLRQGITDSAREDLEEVLRQVPDHREARSLLNTIRQE
jgi:tetratricopeptide (TPR) repeat protein